MPKKAQRASRGGSARSQFEKHSPSTTGREHSNDASVRTPIAGSARRQSCQLHGQTVPNNSSATGQSAHDVMAMSKRNAVLTTMDITSRVASLRGGTHE